MINYLFVEPSLRGSRLQVLAWMVRAIRAEEPDADIAVLTRDDWESPHYHELLGEDGRSVTIFPVPLSNRGQWVANLNVRDMFSMLAELRRVSNSHGVKNIIFCALDECLLTYSLVAPLIAVLTRGMRLNVIKYRVEYLLPARGFPLDVSSIRNTVLRIMTCWAIAASRARLLIFDERLAGKRFGGFVSHLLPDPWVGNFSPARREAARAALGFQSTDIVALALGRFDRRKGAETILTYAELLLARHQNLKLLIVGKADTHYVDGLGELIKNNSNRVVHLDSFVPEDDLPDLFASADIFLMPYSKEFTSSSGTLPRAAASGVPVITGQHGLVGYRVRENGLGELFDVEARNGFADAVGNLVAKVMDPSSKLGFQRNLSAFSMRCGYPAFARAVVSGMVRGDE